MPVAEADNYHFDVLDITKVWPHADYPPITIGKMVLDRNPENYFAEVEQAAFNPSNFVPGIGPSADKMLQGRLFSYHDTHLHRLGSNYHLLPINAPKHAPMTSYQRDGHMRFDENGASGPNYWPNSMGGPGPDASVGDPGMPVTGETGRTEYSHPNDDFVQPGALFRDVMTDEDRDHLISNIVGHLSGAQERIKLRQCAVFSKVDPDLGARVASGVGVDTAEVERLAAMSDDERGFANQLLRVQKNRLQENDPTITGFNVGMNCGEDSGQTVMHAHIHLIPRRKGDVSDPRGGVRGCVPEKMGY